MSGLMTVKLDQLFKALTENSPITTDLIGEAKTEYLKLRSTAQNGEKLKLDSTKKGDVTDNGEVLQEMSAEVKRLQTELILKSKMCTDLQDQLRRYQMDRTMEHEQGSAADLNDPERVWKIGRMYAQLYDNQWMEAYQYLDNIMNLREDKILEILQRIIRGAYVFCQDIAKSQLSNLGGEITCPLSTWTENKRMQMLDNGSDVRGKIAEVTRKYRETSSMECVPNLQKAFSEVILPSFFEGREYRNQYVIQYAERCVAVCWYMSIMEPPMILVSKIVRKADFNSNLFRPYTKSGDKYDFLVFPALRSRENGTVIEKGVAQPLDSAISPLSLRSQKTPSRTNKTPRSTKHADDKTGGLRGGTPWGSQNDPNAPSPSIDLPKTPASVITPRDSARGTQEAPMPYPASARNPENDVLTAAWKPAYKKTGK